MAERSTAAVDVASTGDGDEETRTPESAEAPTDPTSHATADGTDPRPTPAGTKGSPGELHSGHKLARRYRLEECTTRLDGFSSWRAVDEKLRRAVGVHLLPSSHSRARDVLDAARSSALLGDPRFVQVLDAVEEDDMVYVVHEWLPDAVPLTEVLASGALEPYDAYQLAHQVAQAMASAHREGLAHLRLTPGAVLRTGSGQYRIRGLAVNAALRGITAERPERVDTEAIGALLYASLTQRWPYEQDAYGLSGVAGLAGGTLPPDQVRAGVHRGLSDVAMRALVNEGATAASQDPACTTPQELVAALTELPRIKPPEPVFPASYQQQEYPPYARRGAYPNKAAVPAGPRDPAGTVPTPPALPGRTGKILKWGVSALLIAALGLGSWQVADALMNSGGSTGGEQEESQNDSGSEEGKKKPAAADLPIQGAREYYPDGRPQAADKVALSYDGDPKTYWNTKSFQDGPATAPYKEGVGIVYDLGKAKKISSFSLDLRNSGDRTEVSLYAPDSLAPSGGLGGLPKLGTTTTSTNAAAVKLKKPVESRYVLVWLTAMPHSGSDGFSSAGYKQGISHVAVKGS